MHHCTAPPRPAEAGPGGRPASSPAGEFSSRAIRGEATWPLRHEVMWPEKPVSFVKLDGDLTDEARHFGLCVKRSGGTKTVCG